MPPRKYGHVKRHRDKTLYPTPFPYQNSIHHGRGYPAFDPKLVARWNAQAGHTSRLPARYVHYPTLNGRNDPLTIMLVLDALLNLEIDAYITAGGLTRYLREHHTDVMWDVVTVGRILAEITNQSRQIWPTPTLDRLMLGGAKQYVVPDTMEAWSQLGELREYFGTLAEHRAQVMRNGHIDLPTTTAIWELPGFHEPDEDAA